MTEVDVFGPLSSLQWVDRTQLHANDYNPNKVSEDNLQLLVQSILTNGWTLPIVVRPDYTIIDGFHRWTVSGREPLLSKLGGKVPVVIVNHESEADDIYGTITHNRARGTHLLEPMKAIVRRLIDEGKTVQEAIADFNDSYEEIKSYYLQEGLPFQETSFEFYYDVASFLSEYCKAFSLAGLERITGISQAQLGHFLHGRRKPSQKTIHKIQEGVERFAGELTALKFA